MRWWLKEIKSDEELDEYCMKHLLDVQKSIHTKKLEKKLLIAQMTLKKIAYNEDTGQSRSIAYKGLQKMRDVEK